MTSRVFIDGEAGTTGLQIYERLRDRADLELFHLDETVRRDPEIRREALNRVDLAILCLPDDAAREAVTSVTNPDVRLIDASTAHRVADGWTYGFPEWEAGQSDAIASAKRVTNPGCYACASVAILYPLVKAGVMPVDFPVTINAVSGYSGGGKSLIAKFEDETASEYVHSKFYVYGLGLAHKHVEEIRQLSGLMHHPVFMPSVGRFSQGMIVQVPLHLSALPSGPGVSDIEALLRDHYTGAATVTVEDTSTVRSVDRLDPEALNGTDDMRLYVFGNIERNHCVIAAQLDNLGKGAAGQAVQNLDLMLGGSQAWAA